MDWKKHLTAAVGYLELGMPQEAWDELEGMPAEDKAGKDVFLMRLNILQIMKKWGMGAEIARGAVKAYPECSDFYLIGAYLIRRAEDVEAAYDFLWSGHRCMEENAMFWFNLGCYHCLLGRNKQALICVGKAVKFDKGYQRLAVEDEDLEPLWDSMAVKWP